MHSRCACAFMGGGAYSVCLAVKGRRRQLVMRMDLSSRAPGGWTSSDAYDRVTTTAGGRSRATCTLPQEQTERVLAEPREPFVAECDRARRPRHAHQIDGRAASVERAPARGASIGVGTARRVMQLVVIGVWSQRTIRTHDASGGSRADRMRARTLT